MRIKRPQKQEQGYRRKVVTSRWQSLTHDLITLDCGHTLSLRVPIASRFPLIPGQERSRYMPNDAIECTQCFRKFVEDSRNRK
jgi:hypothetical protein